MELFEKNERLVRLSEFLPKLPICRSTFLNGVKKGVYPAPVKIGERAVAWRLGDIKNLLKNGI
ncbi:MAG: helix-turn-helix transcriptional regulator [bacterium]